MCGGVIKINEIHGVFDSTAWNPHHSKLSNYVPSYPSGKF